MEKITELLDDIHYSNINYIIKNKLIALADNDYKIFSSKLLPNTGNILGVRVPILKKIAKEISKKNWQNYLSQADNFFFEETMLQGLVITYIKADIDIVISYMREFIKKINNWSVCDTFCFNLKICQKSQYNLKAIYNFIVPYLSSSKEFEIRFAVVMLLRWFNQKDFIEQNLKLLDSIKIGNNHSNQYYAKMAIAWAISTFFATCPSETKRYLENNNLDEFTHKKALQKIKESKKANKYIN